MSLILSETLATRQIFNYVGMQKQFVWFLSFIDLERGGFDEILPEVIILVITSGNNYFTESPERRAYKRYVITESPERKVYKRYIYRKNDITYTKT